MRVFRDSLPLFFEALLVLISGADGDPENPLHEGTPNLQNTEFYASYFRLGSVLLT